MVSTVPRYVAEIRPYFATPDKDLLKVVLNAVSNAEANLALDLLIEKVPPKSLVTAANLREAIKDLPRCPIPMAVDFSTLARVWELERHDNSYVRAFEDPAGDYEVCLLGEGNMCFDIVVRTEDGMCMWLPDRPEEDFVDTDVMDLVMERQTLLRNVVDLVHAMGLPFSPTFYLSLEDWHLEYAESIFSEFDQAFRRADEWGDLPLF